MLAKIKVAIGIAVSSLIAFLYFTLRIEKSERRNAEQKAEKYEDAAKSNEETLETYNEINRAKEISNTASNSDIDGMLSKYDRDKN